VDNAPVKRFGGNRRSGLRGKLTKKESLFGEAAPERFPAI